MTRRRLHLNLSVRGAVRLVPPMSKDTWARVEAGLPVQGSTYDRVEAALGWTAGSCRKIIDGGEAVPLDSADLDGAALARVPQEEVAEAFQLAMVAGTNLSPSKIREVNAHALEILRRRGILPPED